MRVDPVGEGPDCRVAWTLAGGLVEERAVGDNRPSIFNAESKFGSVADYEDTPGLMTSASSMRSPIRSCQFSTCTISRGRTSICSKISTRLSFNTPCRERHPDIRGSQAVFSADRRGVDEIDYEKLTVAEIRTQWTEAGAKYIAAPGCSVPNSSTSEELARFPRALGA
jgi:hypothetical protein